MAQEKLVKPSKSRWFNTTVGEFVEAVYDAAMEEYMDEVMARRIAMQMLLRKLRMQHHKPDSSKDSDARKKQKAAHLRSELLKRRGKKA